MKRILDHEADYLQRVQDGMVTKGFKAISLAALEKDILVTEVIHFKPKQRYPSPP